MLLRHAKALRPPGAHDHERPLAPSGRAAAPLMAAHMRAEGFLPDAVIVSTALRTLETWELARENLTGETPAKVETDFRIYEANFEALLAVISGVLPEFKSLLIVGHNPGMSELAVLGSEPMRSDRKALATAILKYPTCSLAVIDFNQEHWTLKPRTGKFQRFITPSMIGGRDEE